MAQAINHSTSKNNCMNTVVSGVSALITGVLLDDQEEIRAAADILANECGIELPEFGFSA